MSTPEGSSPIHEWQEFAYWAAIVGLTFGAAAVAPEGWRRAATAISFMVFGVFFRVCYSSLGKARVWWATAAAIAFALTFITALLPLPGTRVTVEQLPAGTLASKSFSGGGGVVVPLPLNQIPRPPDELDEYKAWTRRVHANDAFASIVELAATSDKSDPVLLTDVRVIVLSREEPLKGTYLAPSGAGALDARVLSFDLDNESPTPEILENVVTGAKWHFPLSVSQGDAEYLLVLGTTRSRSVKWVLEVSYVSGGTAQVVRIDDHGEPFSTTATTKATEHSRLPAYGERIWPPSEPTK